MSGIQRSSSVARGAVGRCCVAGHDRGARVAYRMALDHPARVERLAVLDIIPTGEALSRADVRFALAFWPWSLLAQPEPLPERLILADPEIVVDDALKGWGSVPVSFPPDVRAAYIEAHRNPDTVHAICEEYRAASTIDFAKDLEDRAIAGGHFFPEQNSSETILELNSFFKKVLGQRIVEFSPRQTVSCGKSKFGAR
jgi:pimeloyl-ACP methyl ester carboxylesterase